MINEEFDVLIIGAGVSGIGVGARLLAKQPGRTFAILEARDSVGGTWDLFRFPGVRSDSDLHTYAYDFKPWTDARVLADGGSILDYLQEAVAETGIGSHIRFNHKVTAADWSTEDGRWTVTVGQGPDGETAEIKARWLVCGSGYFRYDRGYRPEIPGLESFDGATIHPQDWPEDVDYTGKRVVVIGSGATAVTLVPAIAEKAAHVTMLQRTPTYMLNVPQSDGVFDVSKRLFGARRAHQLTRWKNARLDALLYRLMRRFPDFMGRQIRSWIAKELPDGFDVDTHFNPPYKPWDQRVCAVLDGDFFRAIREGRADVVTEKIREIKPDGIQLESGELLPADVIVTATGLEIIPMGGIAYQVDGRPIDLGETVTYKSMMLSGIPNFVYLFGYVNASWTLKVDLVAEHFCRILALLHEREYDIAIPQAPGPSVPRKPMLDLTAGYVLRGIDKFPKQAALAPWMVAMDYTYDRAQLVDGPVGDHLRLLRVDDGSSGRPSATKSAARTAA